MEAKIVEITYIGALKDTSPGVVGTSFNWPTVAGIPDSNGWSCVYRVEFNLHPSTMPHIMSCGEMGEIAAKAIADKGL